MAANSALRDENEAHSGHNSLSCQSISVESTSYQQVRYYGNHSEVSSVLHGVLVWPSSQVACLYSFRLAAVVCHCPKHQKSPTSSNLLLWTFA